MIGTTERNPVGKARQQAARFWHRHEKAKLFQSAIISITRYQLISRDEKIYGSLLQKLIVPTYGSMARLS